LGVHPHGEAGRCGGNGGALVGGGFVEYVFIQGKSRQAASAPYREKRLYFSENIASVKRHFTENVKNGF